MKRFLFDKRGNFATAFGVLGAVFAVAVAMAMQIAGLTHAKSALQDITDAAVLAAADEAQLSNFNQSVAEGVAENFVVSNMTDRMRDPKVATHMQVASASSQFARTEITVDVTAKVDHPLWSAGGNTVELTASATARIRSAGKICVIMLEESADAALSLSSLARLTAKDCAIYSNSVSQAGIVAKNKVRVDSQFICTAGGYKGGPASFSSIPLTDCPPTPDPLAGRAPPKVDNCLAANTDVKISKGLVTLKPGTYCGGVSITGAAIVTLSPGVYIFKDGPLTVSGASVLKGEYVGLYFTGKGALADFGIGTTIDLGAPKSGPMAGLLIFQDRANSTSDVFKIRATNARNLLGTIYIPRGGLLVDASGVIADQSAYTTIVARKMKLMNGPNLTLNTDYTSTDVPVPDGVGPIRGTIVLSK